MTRPLPTIAPSLRERFEKLQRWCVMQNPRCNARVISNSCGMLLDYNDVKRMVEDAERDTAEAELSDLRTWKREQQQALKLVFEEFDRAPAQAEPQVSDKDGAR